MKKYIISLVILTVTILFQCSSSNAQDPNQPFQQDPGNTGSTQADPAGPPPPNDAPIDGGLSLLLAAGAAYGVKKYREGKKKEEKN